jgi:hypothetical protein
MHPSSFPQRLNAGGLIVSQALDGLQRAGLTHYNHGGYGGTSSVSLSSEGRDYVIKAGFAPRQPRRRY